MFLEKLETILPEERLREKELMDTHTTFRTGGPADYYVEPENREQLAAVLALCREQGVPFYILGNGSNLLVGDKGYRGVMVSMGRAWSRILVEGCYIRAGAGAALSAVAREAQKNGLTGLEFAAGIPGTVGGAVVMNAGAYGSEMSGVLTRVTVLAPDGQFLVLGAGELELGYRRSCIPEREYVVLDAEFKLVPGDPERIQAYMNELSMKRRSRQPLEYPSAGSTFKRPEGHFAGKLIMDAGLRGFSVGGAAVSEKHCGFVINRGGALASDIMELCRIIQTRVRDQYGVELEMEVKVLGDF